MPTDRTYPIEYHQPVNFYIMEMLDRAEQLNEEVATPNLPNEELPG